MALASYARTHVPANIFPWCWHHLREPMFLFTYFPGAGIIRENACSCSHIFLVLPSFSRKIVLPSFWIWKIVLPSLVLPSFWIRNAGFWSTYFTGLGHHARERMFLLIFPWCRPSCARTHVSAHTFPWCRPSCARTHVSALIFPRCCHHARSRERWFAWHETFPAAGRLLIDRVGWTVTHYTALADARY